VIDIEFDKPRRLHFDLAAIRALEASLDGKPLSAVVTDISRLGVNALVYALWAGLKHEDRALNPKLVEKILDSYIREKKSLLALCRAINDAIEETGLFRNEDEDAQVGNEQTAAKQATTTS